jgi:glycosyltransferase involved in cell wall biosynthesis
MTKDMPKVTVGLCVKNIEATVSQSVKSILDQDFPHDLMELIVVDGYSKDMTLKIINKCLSTTQIRYRIFSESNGLGLQRQIVVKNAYGNYIVWVDGDIVLPLNHVKKQVEFMDRNPRVGIGRARYGLLHGEKAVAFLENVSFIALVSKYEQEAPVEISGTGGSIYRREAINQAGGFDTEIVGAGEDSDLAQRMKAAGWLSRITPALFFEHRRGTWKALWDEYFWWGYGGHYNFHKKPRQVRLYRKTPPAGFLVGMFLLFRAYKLSHRKITLLLPFHYCFKRIAWCFGFTKSHIDGYGHKQTPYARTLN